MYNFLSLLLELLHNENLQWKRVEKKETEKRSSVMRRNTKAWDGGGEDGCMKERKYILKKEKCT